MSALEGEIIPLPPFPAEEEEDEAAAFEAPSRGTTACSVSESELNLNEASKLRLPPADEEGVAAADWKKEGTIFFELKKDSLRLWLCEEEVGG